MSEVQAEESKRDDLKEFFSTIKIDVTPTGPEFARIYVVKLRSGHYLRSTGGPSQPFIGTKSRRLATRWDSYTWAAAVAAQYQNAKIVRLLSRAEKDLKSATGKTWVRRTDKDSQVPPNTFFGETTTDTSGGDGGKTNA